MSQPRSRFGSPEEFQFQLAEPAPPPALPALAEPPPRRLHLGRWALAALGLFLVGALALDAVTFIEAQWQRSAALGAVFTALLAAAVGLVLTWSVGEIRAYRGLRHVEAARDRLLAEGADPASVVAALEEGFGADPRFAAFRGLLHSGRSTEEILLLFDEAVLRPLDQLAYGIVGRAARDVGVVTTVMPTALLDTAIMLWRTLRMVRDVASVYGHRAGIAGTWLLVRRIATGAVVVAATDVAGNLVAQQLGGALFEALAAKLGEGAVAATRTARIGLYAMQLCRVLPFAAEDLPTVRRLLQQVILRER